MQCNYTTNCNIVYDNGVFMPYVRIKYKKVSMYTLIKMKLHKILLYFLTKRQPLEFSGELFIIIFVLVNRSYFKLKAIFLLVTQS